MLRRALIITSVTVGLVAASFGSAQAATVSPDKWSPKFCTALETWQTTISEKGDALTAELENVTDLEEGRTQIVDFLGDMVDATNDARSAIKRAGSPSSPNGAKIAALFVAGYKSIAKEFSKAQDQAERLPVTTPTAFKTKGKELGVALSDAGAEFGDKFSAISKLDTGRKLEKAIKAAPECAFLS